MQKYFFVLILPKYFRDYIHKKSQEVLFLFIAPHKGLEICFL
ncbi:hypothetical protein SAMN05216293_1948 [Flagellimonas taeanensis]|uniref:Uncharacterized protein n=1 Tax=Flagellimonas taeanensis TaxID=1005926 RepID=A0A1M6V9C2_9FLAO|nr:hypothetical protein SAMN05216293_1948 [Allomuricauda taeanensis]